MGRWGRVPVVLAGVLGAVVVVVGGVVLAGRGGYDGASPSGPTTTALDGHMHAPGEDGMSEPLIPALTCDPEFDDTAVAEAVPPPGAPPGDGTVAEAEGPPSATCLETGTGCVVSFSMRWSDGYVEGASRAADAPGTYTLTGERGAEATFTVDDTQTCTDPAITYREAWSASRP